MFLTPPSPSRTKIFSRFPNETSLSTQAPDTRTSPADANHLPPLEPSCPSREMTTPHRGLDHGIPPGMILPDPLRQPQQSLPAPPQVRSKAHDSSQLSQSAHTAQSYDREDYATSSWQPRSRTEPARSEELRTRQEEDKRKQEELKTRQEELRLEQRRIEQEMLRDSIAKGIHPNLVPLIFIGLGGAASGASGGFEMAQQYIAQFQSVGQQVQSQFHANSPSDQRRDGRAGHAGPLQLGAMHQPVHPIGVSSGPSQPGASPAIAAGVYPSPAYQSPQSHARPVITPASRFAPINAIATIATTAPPKPSPLQSSLPRLTTNEPIVQSGVPIHINAHSQALSQPQGALGGPIQALHHAPELSSVSPSGISFHHWQPPSTGGRDSHNKTSPQNRPGLVGESTTSSPRKRKATGSHQAAPPPTSAPLKSTSPSLSTTSMSSKRPGRRRSSAASSSMVKDAPSRAQSNEPSHTSQTTTPQAHSQATPPESNPER